MNHNTCLGREQLFRREVGGIFECYKNCFCIIPLPPLPFSLVAQSFPTLCHPWTVAHQAPVSMEFSSKNTRVGSHSFLQGIFLIQGSNPDLLHCRQTLYQLSHRGSHSYSCLQNLYIPPIGSPVVCNGCHSVVRKKNPEGRHLLFALPAGGCFMPLHENSG